MDNTQTYIDRIISIAETYAPKIILALLVLLGGFWVIERITRTLNNTLEEKRMDKNIKPFLNSFLNIGLKVLLLFSIAGILGIETASFVGVIAALAFAIGMALQGNLNNFASGVMILLIKPYKVGDEAKIKGEWGIIQEIQIFHTVLRKWDKTLVIIPNGVAMANLIFNLSSAPVRQIIIKLVMPYTEDFEATKRTLLEAAEQVPYILNDPAPSVVIIEFQSHGVLIKLGVHAAKENFWKVNKELKQNVFKLLGERDMTIAYPEGITFGTIGSKSPLRKISSK